MERTKALKFEKMPPLETSIMPRLATIATCEGFCCYLASGIIGFMIGFSFNVVTKPLINNVAPVSSSIVEIEKGE